MDDPEADGWPRIPLPEWLGPIEAEAFDPALHPEHAWGLFETMDDDGRLGWLERVSEDFDVFTIHGHLAGLLGDLDRHDAYTRGDPEPRTPRKRTARFDAGSDAEADNAGASDVADHPHGEPEPRALDQRFDHLTFRELEPQVRLTGRFVLLVTGWREPGSLEEIAGVVFPGLDDGAEYEGLLRLAVARFVETLTWEGHAIGLHDRDEEEDEALAPGTTDTTLGALLDGWTFSGRPEDVTLLGAWVAIEVESVGGERCWVERTSRFTDVRPLVAEVARAVALLEAGLVAQWDPPGYRPPGVRPLPVPDADDPDPAGQDGPLPPFLSELPVASIPTGWAPRRCMIVAPGLDADGHPVSYWSYTAAADAGVSPPYVSDYTELGLLRGLLRDLLR